MNLKLFYRFFKTGFLFFVLFACPVYAAQEQLQGPGTAVQEQPVNPAGIKIEEASQNTAEVSNLPVRQEHGGLTPEAKEIYAYLLFIQAIFDEDEADLLAAVPHLADIKAPVNIWLDGGVWLMGRKSPNSVMYLENAIKVHPEDASLNLLYAESLGDHGMASKGVQFMREYSQKNPDSQDARIELALLLVKNKQFEEAQKILNSIQPKHRGGLVSYYQARALIGMGKPQDAIPWLKKTVKDLPDFVEAWAELAYLYEKEGNLRESRNCYEKLQKLNFSPQEVALRLASLSLKLKQPEKAVQYIRQGPDTLAFRISAAHLLMEARHYLQAETILKQIAEKQDAPLEVFLILADLAYEQRNNLNMALGWLDKAPNKNDSRQKTQILRSQLLAQAGKTKEALEITEKNRAEFPDSPAPAELYIQLLAREKKTADAIKAAREAVKKWPDNTVFNFILGSLLDESGQKKEAMEIMENIVKKDADNYQALNYIGYTLAEEGRELGRALDLLKQADKLAPNQAYIIDSLAWAYFKAGLYEDALREIRRAIALEGSLDAAIWEHYGDIAAQSGKKDEAKKAYRKALGINPANSDKIRKKISTL